MSQKSLRGCASCGVLVVVMLSVATPAIAISEGAQEYLLEALDIIQENALNSDKIDWDSWRDSALRRAGSARSPRETYPVIRLTPQRLQDNHSFLVPPMPDSSDSSSSEWAPPPFVEPTGVLIAERVAILTVPACSGAYDDETTARYANTLHQLICELRADGAAAWIVDLRGNGGGNMWPMIAGLGPLLGEGVVGFMVYPADGREDAWSYQAGASYLEEQEVISVDAADLCPIMKPLAPVAVLIGPETASSGEATAISFIGRENTRILGQASAGLTTATMGFDLSDGAAIVLTVAVFADRTGTQYGEPIIPDEEIITSGTASGSDEGITAAIEWLREQSR